MSFAKNYWPAGWLCFDRLKAKSGLQRELALKITG